MSTRNLLIKVATARNPYDLTISNLIKETKYISWRKHLQKATINKIPLFIKLINNVDKSITLPLYQVIERLFLNEKYQSTNIIVKSDITTSCFRNSSLPPIGLLLISLFVIANNMDSKNISHNVPCIVHRLGYASELIQIGNKLKL